MISTIREITDLPLAVDANQGWKDKEKALFSMVQMDNVNSGADLYVKLKGLDPDKYYIDDDTDEVYSGALLMNAGICLPNAEYNDGQSFIKYFKAVENN